MKSISVAGVLLGLTVFISRPARAVPAFFIESTVAAPGQPYLFHFVYNNEIHMSDICFLDFAFQPITPDAPAFLPSGNSSVDEWCVDSAPTGPGPIRLVKTGSVMKQIPEGSVYRIQISSSSSGPKDGQRKKIAGIQSHDGYLIVRNKPLLKGDLNDNGTAEIGDAIRSLQLAVGLVDTPTPYEWAADDFNGDGQLTLSDTLLILQHWILGLPQEGQTP